MKMRVALKEKSLVWKPTWGLLIPRHSIEWCLECCIFKWYGARPWSGFNANCVPRNLSSRKHCVRYASYVPVEYI
jgi:hypothetical protein